MELRLGAGPGHRLGALLARRFDVLVGTRGWNAEEYEAWHSAAVVPNFCRPSSGDYASRDS